MKASVLSGPFTPVVAMQRRSQVRVAAAVSIISVRLLSVCAWLLIAAACAGAPNVPAQAADPAQTDPDKYRVILENESVRVLRYRDKPGDKTNRHHHPNFVMYALAPFRRQLTFPDGKTKQRQFKAGDVAWMPAQTHVGENIGNVETDALIIELKQP